MKDFIRRNAASTAAVLFLMVGAYALLSWVVFAQELTMIDVSSNRLDGAFAPADDVEIDLDKAVDGDWDDVTRAAGDGVYDAEKWAVVFHFSSVTIPEGVTVTFANHSSGAPVVWLVDGDVTIDGTIELSGETGMDGDLRVPARPGPGGFGGGCGTSIPPLLQGGGFGPGGGSLDGERTRAGSYGTPGAWLPGETYGNPSVVPLIGGSGGAGNPSRGQQGGAGGGAIFIAAKTLITVNGAIIAKGGKATAFTGSTGGSGGAIRLLAPFVRGSGELNASGGSSNWSGGAGRIRVEALDHVDVVAQGSPAYTFEVASDPPLLWPPADTPSVRVSKVLVGGELLVGGEEFAVPDDPHARLDFPNADLNVPEGTEATIEIVGTDLPADTLVRVRIVPKSGPDFFVTATPVDGQADTWSAIYTPTPGVSTLQVIADLPAE